MAVDTMLLSMADSAMATINAASTGPRCWGRAAASRASAPGGAEAPILRHLNPPPPPSPPRPPAPRPGPRPGPPAGRAGPGPWPDGQEKRHNVAMTASAAPPVETGSRPLLSVQGLAARFGPLRALDRVDLCLRPGELVALAGENGAGKTTLVRCISGGMAPAAGEVLRPGRPVPADPAAVLRRGVAVVWQDLALCDNLDIAANILLGRERRWFLLSDTRQRAAAAGILRALGIPLDDPSRGVRTLSRGQRQLLAVARAMSWKPQLLILDEPTASLGVTETAQVEGLITSLRLQGTTILLVSHDVEQMFRLADRIVVLRHGRVAGD